MAETQIPPAKKPYMDHCFLPKPYLPRCPGIYAIVNRCNNKLYIGSASNISTRWNDHRHDFFLGKQNPHLMSAFRREPSAFYFEVVEELLGATKHHRLEREQFWMDFYRSYIPENGYNLCPKATSCEGVKHGPEYSAALSARFKGKKWSEEAKANFRAIRRENQPRGWHWSEEAKKRHSLRKQGEHPKSVIQLDKSLNPIKTFKSLKDAAASVGIYASNICVACRKGRKRGGFYWRYE